MRLAHEARRIATQHDYLDALESTTRLALERGDPREMGEALRGFDGALDAHFSLEEQVHFPALHGLDGSLGAEIETLVREHGSFRQAMAGLRARIPGVAGTGLDPGILAEFERLAAVLRSHEQREEALLRRPGDRARK